MSTTPTRQTIHHADIKAGDALVGDYIRDLSYRVIDVVVEGDATMVWGHYLSPVTGEPYEGERLRVLAMRSDHTITVWRGVNFL